MVLALHSFFNVHKFSRTEFVFCRGRRRSNIRERISTELYRILSFREGTQPMGMDKEVCGIDNTEGWGTVKWVGGGELKYATREDLS